ncbi:MAG: ribonuclease R [Bacteroidetes bacterium]|nr:ribonuclease R [Bacteroidota bacterium]
MGRKNNKKKKQAPKSIQEYVGAIEITRSGMGFVVVNGLDQDVIVKPQHFNRAFHGDTVRIEILRGDVRAGRLQGKVSRIVNRKQKQFVGIVEVNKDFAFFIPDSDKPIPDFFIPLYALNGAKDGDRVIAQIVDWEEGDKRPKGEVIECVNERNHADLSMKDILIQNGFLIHFPEDVLESAQRIPQAITKSEIAARKDMRSTLTITIDPEDAKDFDDAISFHRLDPNHFEIGVHIADVSHYLEENSVLDQHAYERATSVYLPDRVVPMLPEELSNGLCSLRPHEEKLCYSCVFSMDRQGNVSDVWIGKTVIKSNHRFTYEEVQQILDTEVGLYDKELITLNTMAQHMRKKRMRMGAINFSSQEVRFKLDDQGRPIGVVIREGNASHQLIEEFMLLANRTVAEFIGKHKVGNKPMPLPYRVHDQPDEDRLIPFVEFARKYGYTFNTQTPEQIASSFNTMLQKVQGLPEQRVLEQMGIRTMAKATYTTKNIGHYGLGFESYCHFTSPIRRYPDVLVHRILSTVLSGAFEVDKKLESKCQHCSERERSAMEAERAGNKYKQVQYMSQFVGEEFNAVVCGVASFGCWAETIDHKCEGFISATSLLDYDDFIFHEHEYALIGKRSAWAFRIGDAIRIKVIAANLDKRQLDYEWILDPDGIPTKLKRTKK